MFDNTTFNRVGADSISTGAYNFIIGATLLWGFLLNFAIVSTVDPASIGSINPIILLVAYFGLCLGGIYLFTSSDNPAVSFLGYNLVVIPFGFMLNLYVSNFDPNIVREAIQVTGGVTLIMTCMASIFPNFFKGLGPILFISLIAVIIVEVLMMIFMDVKPGIMDWIVAIIFCGYIGYDWAKAQDIPKTSDNAIDSAASLYMDIINLFMRILAILGRR